MMQVDTQSLTDLITSCFNLSMDGRLKLDQQKEFNAQGKRLRGSLLNLLSARFNDRTQEVTDANTQLAAVNATVQQVSQRLANVAAALQDVADLVGVLDDLLKLAATFV